MEEGEGLLGLPTAARQGESRTDPQTQASALPARAFHLISHSHFHYQLLQKFLLPKALPPPRPNLFCPYVPLNGSKGLLLSGFKQTPQNSAL